MNKETFLDLLKQNHIDSSIVFFEPFFSDGYCIKKNHFRWEVFIRERGRDYDIIGFPSESDALMWLYEKLVKIYGDGKIIKSNNKYICDNRKTRDDSLS